MKMKGLSLLSQKGEMLRKALVLTVCTAVGVFLLMYPENAKKGVSDGLNMCSDILIPSLFPFLFLSCLMGKYVPRGSVAEAFDRFLGAAFGLDTACFSVFLMSISGGFPVGGKMVKQLFQSGEIDKDTARRLLLFCVNPGPAFAVTAVGVSLFSSRSTGLIIYASVVLSNAIIAFLTRFVFEKPLKPVLTGKDSISISRAFCESGASAASGMLNICCYVLLFSCACEMLGAIIKNAAVLDFFTAVMEVTNGCKRLAQQNNIPLIAGITAFGGLSVLFQIWECIETAGLSLRYYLTSRTVSGFLSVIICKVLLYFFPEAVQTSVTGGGMSVSLSRSGISVSLFMLLTCFLFLIGDFTVKSGHEVERKEKM